jgi:glycerol-3-phosphate acyltransferase PlsY
VLIALAVFAFLLGSVPFGVIICRAKGIDIFSVGSGNIGATNVVRAVGPGLGTLVFVLDVAKGYIPGFVARITMHDQPFGIEGQTWSFILGCVAIFGHMFSPWIKFKGGKGIATGLGTLLSSVPLTGLLAFGVMILVTWASRYVSLGSILAVISTIPISYFVSKDTKQVMPFLVLATAIVVWKHRPNIGRILNGTESKFRFKKNEEEPKEEERNDENNRL